MARVTRSVDPPQKCALQQVTAAAARGRNYLINESFIAPNELETTTDHSSEKIYVFSARAKLGFERHLNTRQNFTPEEHIPGPGFCPSHLITRRVSRALKELTVFHPSWRLGFVIGFYGPQDPVYTMLRESPY